MPGMETSTGVSAALIHLLDASELDAKTVQGDGGERDTTNGRKDQTGGNPISNRLIKGFQ